MKTAGSILSALFDKRFVEKAQGYSKLFNSWAEITEKNGIAAAAAHSRIKDIDRGILLVEMDHPGWKQILQTKQSSLLNDFRRRFPQMEISAISLMLAPPDGENQSQKENQQNINEQQPRIVIDEASAVVDKPPAQTAIETAAEPTAPAQKGLDAIKDEEFKEILIRLGKTIADSEKKR